MKYLLLTVILFCSVLCFAQEPNSDLYQTWSLYYVQQHDGAPSYMVSEIEPTITPLLTIKEDLMFTGYGACNTFNGVFNVLDSQTLETDNFSNTSDDCEVHSSFEINYFDFMKSVDSYQISSEGENLVLTLYNSIFGYAVFKNKTLNNTIIELEPFEVFPNPTNSILYVKNMNNSVLKIELFDSLGKKIKTITSNFEMIDVASFISGIYTMKFYTEQGVINKKVLKE